MKAYILSIAGVILLSAVLSMIVPNGKTGAFVRGMMKLLILSVVIAPMIGWLKTGEFDFAPSALNENAAYLEKCASIVSQNDESEIRFYLQETFGVTAEAEVTRSTDGRYFLEKITVNIYEFGINGQDGHIDIISRIRSALEERYGCNAEVYDKTETDLGK